MNLAILIEQSYIDSNIKNHIIKQFYTKYGLKYKNYSVGGVIGNVGSLVGLYTNQQFKQNIKGIISDLEKYHPFLKFIGLNFNTYWISKSHLNKIVKLELEATAKIQLPTTYLFPISLYNQAFNRGIYTLIYLLSNKNESTN